MSNTQVIAAPRIFDGTRWHDKSVLVVEDGRVATIVPAGNEPREAAATNSDDGVLVPGFVDLQVNGGGGMLFNDDPSVAAIETICAAHLKRGTTALMVTLVSDTAEKTEAAIAAAIEAQRAGVPGFLGLHLEGPHLDIPGAHDPAMLREMADDDVERLVAAKRELRVLMTTVAPPMADVFAVRALAEAGVTVSIGHCRSIGDGFGSLFDAGARVATHLFNAMPAFHHRDPGPAGQVLDSENVSASIIADGFHVDPVAIALAVRAKRPPGRIFLVSDAMPTVGSDRTEFELGGRRVRHVQGRLQFDDGTLAGAHLDMAKALRFVRRHARIDVTEAVRMATVHPADVVGNRDVGSLAPGAAADFVHLSDDFFVKAVWKGGERL